MKTHARPSGMPLSRTFVQIASVIYRHRCSCIACAYPRPFPS